jgi:hypothetical protein
LSRRGTGELDARPEEVYAQGRELAAAVLETKGTPDDWLPPGNSPALSPQS